ncbi:hypothetical protein AB0B66_38515 [Catellatospora sp. NPDC049111]|uniref:hypothetical protein n=1 Tax=Catellatospora sp. NPDC049111 TaxID=3155271 RepID=UPI0033E8A07C
MLLLVATVAVGGACGTLGERRRETATPSPPRPTGPERPGDVIERQGRAMMAGDEAGWLADVDASNPSLLARYTSFFRVLHALGVSEWQPEISDIGFGETAKIKVKVNYCIVTTIECKFDDREKGSYTVGFASRGDRVLITSFSDDPPGPAEDAKPWDTDELVFRQGERVTVAAPKDLEAHLDRVLIEADAAARVADPYARWDKPSRYLVFVGGKKQWSRWYRSIDEVAGFAKPSTSPYAAVEWPSYDLGYVLRHELGHLATLYGVSNIDTPGCCVLLVRPKWLTEGIAELIGYQGASTTTNDRLSGLRQHLRAGRWDGKFDSEVKPLGKTPDDRSRVENAQYVLSHLAFYCLLDTYGEDAAYTFFRLVARERRAPEDYLGFGKPWSQVEAGCARWIRSVAR